MNFKIIDLVQDTPEWLEYRKGKFNASETPCIMGVGFNKASRIAEIKYFNGRENYQNEAMKQGKEYEPKIRAIINEQLNANYEPLVALSLDDERFSASLDGYDKASNTILEIKFSKIEYELISDKKLSDKYFYQVQHQLFVTKCEKCIFACGYLDDEFNLEVGFVEVLRDEKTIKKLIEAWNEFEASYNNNIVDNEFKDLCEQLQILNKEQKKLNSEIENIKEKLMKKAKNTEIKAFGVSIYKSVRKDSFDYKAYCESQNLKPSDEFKKIGGEIWSVRVSETGEQK